MSNECQYCSNPERGYTDHVFGEYRTEYDVFSDGQLDISLGALGRLTVSNYISVVETKDEKTPYLVTHVNIENDRIGDPFNVDGYDWKRIPIKYCPFCGRKL